jgi:hypothetical protein
MEWQYGALMHLHPSNVDVKQKNDMLRVGAIAFVNMM